MPTRTCANIGKEVRLLTVRQAAAYLGSTVATLYSKVWRREIPFIKLGRSVRFDVIDLDELIARSKVVPQEFPALRDSFQGKK
jgi:excisionase family DNA binding protein